MKCDITSYETKKIVAEVIDPLEEISVKDAVKIDPNKKEGETIDLPLDLQDLGRIAAQTAKQVIFQRVREAERDVIYSEYKDKVGQIISGVVMRKEKGAYFLNLGKTEAVLYFKDTLPSENLKRGRYGKGDHRGRENNHKGSFYRRFKNLSRNLSVNYSGWKCPRSTKVSWS